MSPWINSEHVFPYQTITLCFDTYDRAVVAHRSMAESKSVQKVIYAHGRECVLLKDGTKINFMAISEKAHPPRGLWCACFQR